MRNLRALCAWLLVAGLIVFGGNYFVQVFPLPEGDGGEGDLLLQAMRDGGLMAFIAFSHVVVGVLLILPRTRFVGGLLQLPMSIGILSFHIAMLPAGIGSAVVMLLLNLGALADAPRLRDLVDS